MRLRGCTRNAASPGLRFALLLAAAVVVPSVARPAESPEFRIFALELKENTGVLRLGVRPHFELQRTSGFNPARCSNTTANFLIDNRLDQPLWLYELALGARGRSRAKQRQMLNAIYAAFVTDRLVVLSVREDMCTPATDTPHLSGIRVLD